MRKSKISVVKLLILGVAMLMLGNSDVLAQVGVTLPTITKPAGSADEFVNVTVGDLTGQNVSAFQFDVYYDKNVVYITDAGTAGTLSDGGTISVNADTANGKISVAWAKATAISGSGTLIKLKLMYRNIGTSSLTFVDPNTSLNTFLFNAGSPAATTTAGSVTIPSVAVSMGSLSATVGDTVTIPINVATLTTSDNVTAFNFDASFDKNILNVIGYDLAGTLGDGGTASINPNNTTGTVSFAWAKATSISGAGILVKLKAVAVGGGTSTQSFTAFQFNAGTPNAGTVSGAVTVATNAAPVFTAALMDTTIKENQELTFTYTATDANGDSLTFALVKGPTGSSIGTTTGVFTWTPTYDQAGVDTVTVSVSDGVLSTDASAIITVTNVNRAPVFTHYLPADTTLKTSGNDTLTFTYAASDPDGQAVTYQLVNPPASATINSTSGKLVWIPAITDTGTDHTITVSASDGTPEGTTTTTSKVHLVVGITTVPGIPTAYTISQNYPNPFNPTTKIAFSIPKESQVTLKVYNLLGQVVATLINNERMGASTYQVDFDASQLSSGIYIYRIQAGQFTATRKMTLLK